MPLPVGDDFPVVAHVNGVVDVAALRFFAALLQGNGFGAHADQAGAVRQAVLRGIRQLEAVAVGADAIAVQFARKDAGFAHEVGEKERVRVQVELFRRCFLHDAAFVHDDDLVGDGKGFALVVGDVERGDAEALLQFADFFAHAAAQVGVEVGERFVEKQHFRLQDERAREGDALLLPAGDLIDVALAKAGEVNECQGFFNAHAAFFARHVEHFQAVADVVGNAHVREERVGLEDDADVALLDGGFGDVFAVNVDLAAGRAFETGDEAEDGGFAAAGGAKQGGHGAALDGKIEMVDDHGFAEGFGDVFQDEEGLFVLHGVPLVFSVGGLWSGRCGCRR